MRKICITVRITQQNAMHTYLRIWVNGGLATPVDICLRNDEVDQFVGRLMPDKIEDPDWFRDLEVAGGV